ncbi:MAG: hypothetical protein IIY52_04090 [Solobacterium sp.]|nr:hypothetical protein [Solobacterium sp.]
MKEFRDLTLCSFSSERVDVIVKVDLIDGKLQLSCLDCGPAVEAFFGDGDYEYWYSFSEEETEKLFRMLDGLDHPEEALLERFSGEAGTRELTAFCKEHGIEYRFFSWA